MAGKVNERQEQKFRSVINAMCKQYGDITIEAGNERIEHIIGAKKARDRTVAGHENYADIILHIGGGEDLKLQLKDVRPADYGGGGAEGIEQSVPGLADQFLHSCFSYLTKTIKLKAGDAVPQMFGKITELNKMNILKGSPAIGGPIDYIFIGPMLLTPTIRKNKLSFGLSVLYSVEEYARKTPLFLRLRARTADQKFDPTLFNARTAPRIFGTSPTTGKAGGRIVLEKNMFSGAVLIP